MSHVHLTTASLLILQSLHDAYRFGFDIMEATGLPSGTVYPALKRFEERKFIKGHWENDRTARLGHRPARRYYELTEMGRKMLERAAERFPEKLRAFTPARSPKSLSEV